MTEFDLSLKEQLRSISAEAAQLGVAKQKADIQYTLDQNDRAAAQNTTSIKEATERILRSRAERTKIPLERREILARIQNMEKDGTLKQLDIDLKEKGIQPSDNLFWRLLARLVEKYVGKLDSVDKGLKGGRDAIGNYYPATP